MKTPFFLKKPLDDSAGIGQDDPNEVMNANAQSNESEATLAKKGLLNRIGLLAVLVLTGIVTSLTPIQTKEATFLIDSIISWAAGETLSAASNAILAANGGLNKTPLARLSPSAKAVANTAYWLSNSYNYTHKGGRMEQRRLGMEGKLDNHHR